ncbi:MAG: hypothetical protein ABFR75_05645 [Acidobacteriota bacterium]
MKRLSLLIFVLLLIGSFAFSQSITVTSPNGGEDWTQGSSKNITWTATGLTNDVKITLWKNGVLLGLIAKDIDPTSGSYPWTVGPYIGGTAAADDDYKIKVREQGGESFTTEDMSDEDFSIFPTHVQPTIFVLSPDGGESWELNSGKNIKWTSTGGVGNVLIQLFKDGVNKGVIYSGANTGNFLWKTGEHTGGPAIPGDDYKIKISSIGHNPTSDESKSYFNIIKVQLRLIKIPYNPNGIKLLYPDITLSSGPDGNPRHTVIYWPDDQHMRGWIRIIFYVKNIGEREITSGGITPGQQENNFTISAGASGRTGTFHGYSLKKIFGKLLGKDKETAFSFDFLRPTLDRGRSYLIPQAVFIELNSNGWLPELNKSNNKFKIILKNLKKFGEL